MSSLLRDCLGCGYSVRLVTDGETHWWECDCPLYPYATAYRDAEGGRSFSTGQARMPTPESPDVMTTRKLLSDVDDPGSTSLGKPGPKTEA